MAEFSFSFPGYQRIFATANIDALKFSLRIFFDSFFLKYQWPGNNILPESAFTDKSVSRLRLNKNNFNWCSNTE